MKQHLNTLFVTTQGAYLRKDGQTVDVRIEKKPALRVPLHNLESIVGFGRVNMSPSLMGACAAAGVNVSFLKRNGSFLASVVGPTHGNVLLRRSQYRTSDCTEESLRISKSVVCGKIGNCRTVLRRAARDTDCEERKTALQGAKRLRKVASVCEDYGQRVQHSVFEMKVDWGDWPRIKSELLDAVRLDEDSLRFYYLGSNWKKRVEHHGQKPGYDIDGPLLI